MNLRRWIRVKPIPVSIRLETHAGQKVVQVPTEGARRFADTENAILRLGPCGLVECLAANGDVLRVCELGTDEGETVEGPDDALLPKDAPKNDPVTVALLVAERFAKLVNEAADKAAARHAAAYELAFAKQNEIIGFIVTRLTTVETAYQRQVSARAEEMLQAASAGGDDASGPIQQMLMAAVMGGGLGPKPPATPPNGK